MDAQGFEDITGARHAETGCKDLVKRHVEHVESDTVLDFNSRGLLLEICRERVLVGPRHSAGGFGGNLRFEGAADEETLAHVVERNSRDEGAMLRFDVDETVVGKAADRGGDRKARNAEFFAQSRLVDRTSRF